MFIYQKIKENKRLILSFLLCPVIVLVAFGAVGGAWMLVDQVNIVFMTAGMLGIGMLFGIVHLYVFLVGALVFSIMKRKGWLKAWHAALVGAIAGLPVISIIGPLVVVFGALTGYAIWYAGIKSNPQFAEELKI